MIRNRMRLPVIGLLAMLAFLQVGAQEKKPTLWKRITSNKHLTRIDSVLSTRYFRMGKMDTAYITRPGASAVFNFTNIGNKENLAVNNIKWYVRTFFGLRF